MRPASWRCFDDGMCAAGLCRACAPAPAPALTPEKRAARLRMALADPVFAGTDDQALLGAALAEVGC